MHAVFRREISSASIVASRSSEKRHQLPGNIASSSFFFFLFSFFFLAFNISLCHKKSLTSTNGLIIDS
jgi:hypothetical protein